MALLILMGLNLYSVWVTSLVDYRSEYWTHQDSCYKGSWASCGHLHIRTPAATTGKVGVQLLLLCVSSHYTLLWMWNWPSRQWEQRQRNGYDCGVWLMADVQAIYSGLLAVPMELDTDGFHDRIHQKNPLSTLGRQWIEANIHSAGKTQVWQNKAESQSGISTLSNWRFNLWHQPSSSPYFCPQGQWMYWYWWLIIMCFAWDNPLKTDGTMIRLDEQFYSLTQRHCSLFIDMLSFINALFVDVPL